MNIQLKHFPAFFTRDKTVQKGQFIKMQDGYDFYRLNNGQYYFVNGSGRSWVAIPGRRGVQTLWTKLYYDALQLGNLFTYLNTRGASVDGDWVRSFGLLLITTIPLIQHFSG